MHTTSVIFRSHEVTHANVMAPIDDDKSDMVNKEIIKIVFLYCSTILSENVWADNGLPRFKMHFDESLIEWSGAPFQNNELFERLSVNIGSAKMDRARW